MQPNLPSGLDYASIKDRFATGALSLAEVAQELSDGWAARYREATKDATELVEIDQGELTYLFDIAQARVVGVYGRVSPPMDDYPKARMRGFPLPSSEQRLARGHLVAHSLGGGTDINLVPQDAALNISAAWRAVERKAQGHPGSFIAVEVGYDDDGQTPAHFVYLVAYERELHYAKFENLRGDLSHEAGDN